MKQPELLRHALKRQIRRLGIARKLAGGRVIAAWTDAVGPHIAAHARAESLVDGVLTVVVPDASWRQELTFRKRELIERVNAAVEDKVVRDLFLVAVSRKRD